VNDAVVAVRTFLYLRVFTLYVIALAVIIPNMVFTRTDNNRLLIAVYLFVDIRGDDTVATEGRLIREYVLTRSVDSLLAIGLRETQEGDALGLRIRRMNRQY
jgi:hypothetical protein